MNNQNRITYTDDKLKEFIPQAQKDINDSNKVLTTLQSKVFDVSLRDIMENIAGFQKLLDQIKQMTQVVSKKVDKYQNLIHSIDSPTANTIETLSYQLDDVYLKFSKLEDTLEELILLAQKNNR